MISYAFGRKAANSFQTAVILLLALTVLTLGQSVYATSDEKPPGLQEYSQFGKKALKSATPASLAGMRRARLLLGPFASVVIYDGGEPLPRAALLMSTNVEMFKYCNGTPGFDIAPAGENSGRRTT